MIRIVVDTNILVAAAYAPHSASRRVVDACLDGRLTAVISSDIEREYRHILARAVRVCGYDEQLAAFIDGGQRVQTRQTPRVVPEDAGDDKFVAAALAGCADWLLSNDSHLHAIKDSCRARIASPSEFAAEVLDAPT